jgi:hypothetical protein
MNDGDAGVAVCPLQGRDVLNGAASWPERLHRISEGKAVSRTWSGGPITLGRGEMAVAEWRVRR